MHYLLEQLKLYDLKTYHHSLNVEKIAYQMGDILDLTIEERSLLKTAATFHDCGKMMFNPKILNSAKELTKAERIAINFHAFCSYVILSEYGFEDDVCEIVLIHHGMDKYRTIEVKERNKKLGEILQICDIYCALRENRTYCQSMTKEEALALMRKMNLNTMILDKLDRVNEQYLELAFAETDGNKEKLIPKFFGKNAQTKDEK